MIPPADTVSLHWSARTVDMYFRWRCGCDVVARAAVQPDRDTHRRPIGPWTVIAVAWCLHHTTAG